MNNVRCCFDARIARASHGGQGGPGGLVCGLGAEGGVVMGSTNDE